MFFVDSANCHRTRRTLKSAMPDFDVIAWPTVRQLYLDIILKPKKKTDDTSTRHNTVLIASTELKNLF